MKTLAKSGLLWPGVFTLAALVLLVWLGNWQMRRLAWKEGLITRIEMRAKADPVSLARAETVWNRTGDVEYMRVRANGHFEHGKERHYFTSNDGGTGWHIYTPLRLDDGRFIMVNRGFVSDRHKQPGTRMAGQIGAEVSIVGLLRKPGKKGLFTPDNNVAKNEWYWRDLNGMSAAVSDKGAVYPFFLEAGPASRPAVREPRPGVTRITLSNKHLGYALTWYGLALTLIGVFAAFAWPRLQTARSAG